MILNKIQKVEYENNIRKAVFSRGGVLEDGWVYRNSSTPIPIKCSCGHEWKSLWGHIKRGHWCPECAHQRVHGFEVKRFIENKGGTLNANWSYINKKNKFEIECKEKHRWKTNWDCLSEDSWCPYCAGHTVDENTVRKIIEDKGGKLNLNWQYTKSTDKFFVVCEKGHRWATCWNVIRSGHWCPHCKVYRNEQLFRETLEKYTGHFFPSQRPRWLKYNTRPLELDGYNEKEKIAFEYQGNHHYTVGFFSGKLSLEEVRKRDEFKKKQCELHGVTLIVMPYWVTKENWVLEINNILNTDRNNLCQTL